MKKINTNPKKYGRTVWLMALALGTSLLTTSCGESFLKLDALSFYTPEKIYETESGLQAALTTSDKLLRDYYVTGKFITDYLFTDIAVRGKTDDQNMFTDIDKTLTPTAMKESTAFFWDEGYNGVKYANTVISNIEKVKGLDENIKNAYLGRAYFHRSFHYLNMVFLFKDLPLVTKLPEVPKEDFRSTKREAIIKMLVQNMEFAVQWVPDQKDMTTIGAVNKAACRQLLIKCYLADGQYEKAKEQADLLINDANYRLMQDEDNFGTFVKGGEPETWPITPNVIWNMHRPENKLIPANKETILGVVDAGDGASWLSVETMRNYGPYWNASKNLAAPDGSFVQNIARSNKIYNKQLDFLRAIGRGIADLRPTWYATHSLWVVNGKADEGDLRHSRKVGNWFSMEDLKYNSNPQSPYYGKTFAEIPPTMGDTIRSWFGFQHYKLWLLHVDSEANLDATNFSGASKGGIAHWYVYRLAETYLLRAEANFYLGHPELAAKDVNEVRKRAKCEVLYPEDATFTIGNIMDERARELYLEEFRHVELSRVSYCLAMSGKPDEWGNTYDVNTYDKQDGTDPNGGSYWYQRVMHYNDFYSKGNEGNTVSANGKVFTYRINKHNLYYPVPNWAITRNSKGKLSQNFGYNDYDENVTKWETWEEAVADEDKAS